MTERRPWTEEQDRQLKYIFETSGLTKWSHIARKLQEDYGVKGRNGKQCKERYITHIDTAHPKEEWCYEDEQKMFQLHNELGNKWAIIGSKLGGRSDNSVKNHFYSRLRKALRKINKVVYDHFRKEVKDIKPNVLYRIVEASEEKFKLFPQFERELSDFSNELKIDLLKFSYDQEGEDQVEPEPNVEEARNLIDRIGDFNKNYKKKSKKDRKGSGQGPDLLTPTRYQKKKCNSQNEESQPSQLVPSSETSNVDDLSDDGIHRGAQGKTRRSSMDSTGDQPLTRIRTRAFSQGSLKHQQIGFHEQEDYAMDEEEPSGGIQGILDGLKILEEQDLIPPHPLLMKKETSKYSRYQENPIQHEQYHFFEDSQIEMRILPEMEMGMKRESHDERLFH